MEVCGSQGSGSAGKPSFGKGNGDGVANKGSSGCSGILQVCFPGSKPCAECSWRYGADASGNTTNCVTV